MCNDWTCPLNNGYGCTVTACTRHMVGSMTKSLNELFLEEDNVITSTYIVHVPGQNTATDFASIDEIQEQFGGDKI